MAAAVAIGLEKMRSHRQKPRFEVIPSDPALVAFGDEGEEDLRFLGALVKVAQVVQEQGLGDACTTSPARAVIPADSGRWQGDGKLVPTIVAHLTQDEVHQVVLPRLAEDHTVHGQRLPESVDLNRIPRQREDRRIALDASISFRKHSVWNAPTVPAQLVIGE